MIQITTTIAHGNARVEALFSRVNASLFRRHIDLGLDPNDLVFVTDCPGPGRRVEPLPYASFNFVFRQFHYLHAVKQLGLEGNDFLLRDADTLMIRPFDFPVAPGRIGFVRWRYGNLNCGAVYVHRDAWHEFVQMVEQLRSTGLNYDEKFVTAYMKSRPDIVQLLPPEFNWDVRNAINAPVYLLHVNRKSAAVAPELEALLAETDVLGLVGRGRRFFGKYGERDSAGSRQASGPPSGRHSDA